MRITPPAHVEKPARIVLLDYGLHSSLALEDGDAFVEFAFGHYDWFALNHDRWYHVPGVILLPGRGTLGTRQIPLNADRQPDLPAIEHSYAIVVEQEACAALVKRLRGEFDLKASEAIDNPVVGLRMAPHDHLYWNHYNCNTAVAEWLEAAGCRVHGWRQNAEFVVDAAGDQRE